MFNYDAVLHSGSLVPGKRAAFMLALTVLVSSACGGNTSPGVASGAQAALPGISNNATASIVKGQYTGTFNDNVLGHGQMSAELSEYQHAVGGVLTFAFQSIALITPAAFVLSGTTLTGTGSFAPTSSVFCTFSETATYDTKTHQLNGSYKAVRGCSGEAGTFAMKQNCRYTVDSTIASHPAVKPC